MLRQVGKLRYLLHLLTLQVLHEEREGSRCLVTLLREGRLWVGDRLMTCLTYHGMVVSSIKSGSIWVIHIRGHLLLLLDCRCVLKVLHKVAMVGGVLHLLLGKSFMNGGGLSLGLCLCLCLCLSLMME